MIGMLGGMGPESTAYTYMRMVRYCQERYNAKLDSDFPPVLMFSMPVPDVVVEGSDDSEVLALLDGGIRTLANAGADFSFIACNTMQGFVPALRRKYPMLSLVEETVREAKGSGVRNWGLLGTEVTMRKGYYQQAFAEVGLAPITPSRACQDGITLAIREILAGSDTGKPRGRLQEAVRELGREGAEGAILACTDLPVVLQSRDVGVPLLDTADISARAAVERWRAGAGRPGGRNPLFNIY